MDRKGAGTAVVTAAEVRTSLANAKVSVLEEKVLRMRHGAKVELKTPLPTAFGDDEELGDELMLLEVRLLGALKRHKAQQAKAAAPRNAAKDKIVARLKTKKK